MMALKNGGTHYFEFYLSKKKKKSNKIYQNSLMGHNILPTLSRIEGIVYVPGG